MDKMIFNSRPHWFLWVHYENIHTKQRRTNKSILPYLFFDYWALVYSELSTFWFFKIVPKLTKKLSSKV